MHVHLVKRLVTRVGHHGTHGCDFHSNNDRVLQPCIACCVLHVMFVGLQVTEEQVPADEGDEGKAGAAGGKAATEAMEEDEGEDGEEEE